MRTATHVHRTPLGLTAIAYHDGHGWTAELAGLCARGATAEEAVRKLREMVLERLREVEKEC